MPHSHHHTAASAAPSAAPTAAPTAPHRVCLIGSGNWGSAIARIVGANVTHHGPARFHPTVNMYTYEETLADGRKLTKVINATHENVKYLPGRLLPSNVVAVPSLREAVRGADMLVWVVPHTFLPRMFAVVRAGLAVGGGPPLAEVRSISLIKGMDFDTAAGRLVLISDSIRAGLVGAAECCVLMGANVANEVADGQFCEATIGHDGSAAAAVGAALWRDVFDAPTFSIALCPDGATVELCGALKNVVALAAGFVDGLGLGGNTKAAVMRIGLLEMLRFARAHYGETVRAETFFESCGVADLITTCFGGRNRKCAAAFVERAAAGVTWEEIEAEMLGGQKLQGTGTCRELFVTLTNEDALAQYPLFHATYRVMMREAQPSAILELGGQERAIVAAAAVAAAE